MAETVPCSALFSAIFKQRLQVQQFQTVYPPSRLVVVNPYDTPGVTKFALDMRRKAEVLEYTQNVGAAVPKTKSASWASVVRQQASRRISVTSCPGNGTPTIIYSSVDKSGVPRGGDTEVLYLDPAVPLYHFINPVNERTYVEFENVIPEPFKAIIWSPVIVPVFPTPVNGIPTTVATGMFTSSVLSPQYQLRAVSPIAITVSGNTSARTTPTGSPKITVTVELHLFYNESKITQSSPYSATIELGFPLVATSPAADFTVTKYIGVGDAQNIIARAENGYVYTVRMVATVKFSSELDSTKISAQITANVPTDYPFSSTIAGLDLTPSPSPASTIPACSLTAVPL